MEERQRNIAVGLTSTIGILGLCALLMLFGELPRWFESGYLVKVEMDESAGLVQNSRVHLNGIDIGAVQSVALQEPVTDGAMVLAMIYHDVRIPVGVTANVPRQLIAGSASLSLFVDPSMSGQAFLPTDGAAVIRDQSTSPRGTWESLADNFKQFSDEWTRVGKSINRLVEHRSTDAIKTGQAMGNLSTALVRLDVRLAENVNESVSTLSSDVGESVRAVRNRYVAMADDLSRAVATLQELADRADRGDGTVGQLLNNPALYHNLNGEVERLKKALNELRFLVQKWKAEGLPVSFRGRSGDLAVQSVAEVVRS